MQLEKEKKDKETEHLDQQVKTIAVVCCVYITCIHVLNHSPKFIHLITLGEGFQYSVTKMQKSANRSQSDDTSTN